MKIRRGLIFREFYLNRNSLKLSLIVFAVMVILGLLVSLSAKVGNISKISDPDLKAVLEPFFYYGFTILTSTMLTYLMYFTESMNADIKSGWLNFAKTMPLAPAERAGHTCLAMLAGYITAVILSAFSVLLFGILYGRGFDRFTFGIVLTVYFIYLIMIVVQIAVNYWRQDTLRGAFCGTIAMYAVIFPAAFFIMNGSLINKMSAENEELDSAALKAILAAARAEAEKLMDIMLIAAPIASLALIALLFVIIKRSFERKR